MPRKIVIPPAPKGETPRWLYDILQRLAAAVNEGQGVDGQVARGVSPDGGGGSIGVTAHGLLTGLANDDHTQYALLAGRAGGQRLIGGSAFNDRLTLTPTTYSHLHGSVDFSDWLRLSGDTSASALNAWVSITLRPDFADTIGRDVTSSAFVSIDNGSNIPGFMFSGYGSGASMMAGSGLPLPGSYIESLNAGFVGFRGQIVLAGAPGSGPLVRVCSTDAAFTGKLQEWRDSNGLAVLSVNTLGSVVLDHGGGDSLLFTYQGLGTNNATTSPFHVVVAQVVLNGVAAGVRVVNGYLGALSSPHDTLQSINNTVGTTGDFFSWGYDTSSGYDPGAVKSMGDALKYGRIKSTGAVVFNPNGLLATTIIPLAILGTSGHTASLQEWQNSSGTMLAKVTAAGVFTGNGSGLTSLPAQTNALLDGTAHTDTLAGTVARGDLIIGNSTPKWSRLAIGAAGANLRSDGTDVAWSRDLDADSIIVPAGALGSNNTFDADGFLVNKYVNDTATANTGILSFAGIAAGGTITFPSTGLLVTAASSTTFSGKTLNSSCKIQCNTASGTTFQDVAGTTKQMRFDLSGITAGQTRSVKFPDEGGSVVLVGNTTSAAGVLGVQSLTAQTASLTAKTMLTGGAATAGIYRLSFYLKTTTAGSAGAVVKVTAAWNDGSAQTLDIPMLNATAIVNNLDLATLNAFVQGSLVVSAAASQNITFTTTLSGSGSPQYSIYARIEAL